MKTVLRVTATILLGLLVAAVAAWGLLALWFGLSTTTGLRVALCFGFVTVAVGGLLIAVLRGPVIRPLLPFALLFIVLLAWWSTIEPSNDRVWQGDVARLASAKIDGNLITLRNIRDFQYTSEIDYVPRWVERTYDLRRLETLDLIAVYWMGDAIAHTMLSFGFDGEQVAISIEIRKEQGETYSTLAGLYRRYELYYVVGDERDLIGLRTNYRNPPEDVYLYRVTVPREDIRRLFLQYIKKINDLHEHPEFYNTATTNCTTNIVTHIRTFRKRPLSWKMLLSGYFAEMAYERGSLDQSLPFKVLREKSLVNGRARVSEGADDFSRRIRAGLPGIP